MNGKKVVVIGSGIGGSGVAALLANRRYDVTVLEKNPFYGGKCYGFEKDGFVVDSGVHMYSRGDGGPLVEISRRIGGDIKWLKKRKAVGFLVGGKYNFYYTQPLTDPRMLASMGYTMGMSILGRGEGHFAKGGPARRILGLQNGIFKALKREGGIMGMLKLVANLVSCNEVFISDLDEVSVRDFILGFTDDVMIHQLLNYFTMILTVTPYHKTSAGDFFWLAIQQVYSQGLGVPEGGSRALPRDFLNCVQRDGGKLVLGAPVKKINVKGGQVTGVTTEDGTEYEADYVISNAGIKLTTEMVGEKNLPADYVKRVKGLEMSYSFITSKFGLDKKVVDPGAPCWFSIPNMDPEHQYDHIDEGGVPDDPHLFVPMQSEWDQTVAPMGKQLIIVGVTGPYKADKAAGEQCQKIIDVAEEKFFSVFPEAKNHIEWNMRTDTRYYSKLTGKDTGDCIGLAQIVGQSGIHRPRAKTPVDGLYLVGSDAGARGVGTELAAGSAIHVANMIEK
ncbi:MAG: NAD(P)/FAD-dependent oxidoreductase [Actinobacteria bacterium]|nr:NAD(P)/FAD-dependent oxidoreductase [Actinomycetota bacterium]